MRWVLAQIIKARIAPSAINAPPSTFIPQPMGVGIPTSLSNSNESEDKSNSQKETGEKGSENTILGLQAERINRDAWRGVLDALQRLKHAQESGRERPRISSQSELSSDL